MKLKSTLAVCLLCVLFIFVIEFYYNQQKITLKAHEYGAQLSSYSDSSGNGGRSSVHIDSLDSRGCYISYTLSDVYKYYYAGVQLLHGKERALNLEEYSKATIILNAPASNTMRFFILCHEPSTYDENDPQSWLHMRKTIPLKKGQQRYQLKLDDFYTPQWWFDDYAKRKSQITTTPYRTVLGLKVESGEGEALDVETPVFLGVIVFTKDVPLWLRAVELLLLILMTVVIVLFLRKRLSRAKIGGYEKLSLGNQYDEDVEAVTDYIGRCYPHADLKIDIVAEACCMHPDKVASTIKSEYNQSFKQYLNSIRLTEAKRLLKETDRQISEIARSVGYSNVSHFNRVFKGELDCTPREFRLRRSD